MCLFFFFFVLASLESEGRRVGFPNRIERYSHSESFVADEFLSTGTTRPNVERNQETKKKKKKKLKKREKSNKKKKSNREVTKIRRKKNRKISKKRK